MDKPVTYLGKRFKYIGNYFFMGFKTVSRNTIFKVTSLHSGRLNPDTFHCTVGDNVSFFNCEVEAFQDALKDGFLVKLSSVTVTLENQAKPVDKACNLCKGFSMLGGYCTNGMETFSEECFEEA